jgi:hypothetical protein
MEGYRVWIMSLIEYDAYGKATVLKSFAKPAADSKIKDKKKTKGKTKNNKKETIKIESEELF